jgi:formamidopyrimidine-DNA glycosylase
MPELPEVETIARYLREGSGSAKSVLHRTVESVTLFWAKTLAEPAFDEFNLRIHGQTVQDISRRAKFLVLTLTTETLLMHLRMSGDVRVEPENAPAQKHDRLHIHFLDGNRLVFNDTRKFGRVWLVRDPKSVLGGLGPEPFAPDLSVEVFTGMLKQSRRQIKPLLLDQGFIAGVGNIYSDEALHRARIHPLTPANAIDEEHAVLLLGAIRETLAEGIRRNGASIDWVYRGGDFQNYFRVYQRTGEPCPVCGTAIERQVIGQRSAHFCPTCQIRPYDLQTK